MRRMRQCFLMGLLVGAATVTAHAQWGTTETEHDWRLTIAGRACGLVQRVSYVGARIGGTRRTTIYLGRYTAETRIPAAYVATVMLLPVAVLGVIVLQVYAGKRDSSAYFQ